MLLIRYLFLLLFICSLFEVLADETSSEDEDSGVPIPKRLKNTCYFENPLFSPLEKFPREERFRVSSECGGNTQSLAKLSENFEGNFLGAVHELSLVLGRAEGTFLNENSDLSPWENEAICERHLNELSREWARNDYSHVKWITKGSVRQKACGYPEDHAAVGKFTMSHHMSKNLLRDNNVLVPAGTALCARHYRAIPKNVYTPISSQLPPIPSQCNSPLNSQHSQAVSSDGHNSQVSVDSRLSDRDYCAKDDKAAKTREEMKTSLRDFLTKAEVKRAWCRKPVGEAKERTQKGKAGTVLEIMEIVVGLLTETEEEHSQLMSLVNDKFSGKSMKDENALLHSMMEAVSINFNSLNSYVDKINLLSIFTSHIKYRTISDYIPNLSERMWHEAKKRAMSPAKVQPDLKIREKYDPIKIEFFISFITSGHVAVGLPWGEQKTKDSLGNAVFIPNTVRLTSIYETIALYESYLEETGRESLKSPPPCLHSEEIIAPTLPSQRGTDRVIPTLPSERGHSGNVPTVPSVGRTGRVNPTVPSKREWSAEACSHQQWEHEGQNSTEEILYQWRLNAIVDTPI